MSATTEFMIWCEEKYGEDWQEKVSYSTAVKERTAEQKKEVGDMVYQEIEQELRVVDSPKIDSENKIITIGKVQIIIKYGE